MLDEAHVKLGILGPARMSNGEAPFFVGQPVESLAMAWLCLCVCVNTHRHIYIYV